MTSFAIAALLLWFFGMPAPTDGASAQPKRGGTLTLGITRDMSVLNPLVNTSSTQKRIRDLMFEPLLGIDLKGNLQPRLAESWKVFKDGKLYTFRLRKGVKFHNGQEMTAEDAKFAIDYSMNPKNGARGFAALDVVDRVEASDRYTLNIHMKRSSPGFIYVLAEIDTFSVVPKESLQEGMRQPAKFPPGTGPFILVEWQPQQRIVLTRFDDYWGHKAFVDRVVLRIIGDTTVSFTALRAGDIDMTERAPYEWIKEIRDGKLKGIGFAESRYSAGRGIEFNVADPPFNNKKLRLAVAHAIDRREILQAAYFGFGEPSDQLYPKGHKWYIEGVRSPAYDLNKARALLKEAGYKGEPIEMLGSMGGTQEVETATVQAQLKKIGMNIQIKMADRGANLQMRRKGQYAFKLSGDPGVNPNPVDLYLPINICESDPRNRNQNETGYCDKEVDALLKAAAAEHDEDKLRALMTKIVTKLNQDVPSVTIGHTSRFFAVRDYVKGFTTAYDGEFAWWGGGLNRVWLDK
ncbi:MAG: ABC transporter substrate-binding protein [Candidatus Binatia bacterium]